MINPATGELITEFGPLASAEVILLDEINRIPLKSQSAFLEGLQDRTITVGKTTYELPAFSFAIATMNPVELGQGTFPLSEAATDRFAVMINIGYLPPEEEAKLVNFDFKHVRLNTLMSKERIIAAALAHQRRRCSCTSGSATTSSGWSPPRGPTTPTPTGTRTRRRSWSNAASTSAPRRAPSSAGAAWPRCGRCSMHGRDEVFPEDIQDLAPYVLSHRIWLGPHAASHGLTAEVRGEGHRRASADSMRTREQEVAPLVNLSDITEIELVILKRMREVTMGEHRSLFQGTGFDFVGLRDWQAGDRFASIDWAQSTLTNFSPMVVRDFEQPTTAGRRRGRRSLAFDPLRRRRAARGRGRAGGARGNVLIAHAIARAIATIGMSAVFFQDSFGLITFEGGFEHLQAIRPRIGKGQVVHCLDAYQHERDLEELKRTESLSGTLAGFLRKTSMVPVVSDFLFDDVDPVIDELARLDVQHDVFLVIVDATFAYRLPSVSAGLGGSGRRGNRARPRVVSRGQLRGMADKVRGWQDQVARQGAQRRPRRAASRPRRHEE